MVSATFDPISSFKGRRIGYARVSMPDQKIRSQCDWLRELDCCRIFADKGVSGSQTARPALTEMLEFLQTGDMVITWRLDRLGRSVSHLAQLLNHFDDQRIYFCSVNEGINTATAGGKLVFHIFSAIAEFNRNLIVENTHAGLEAARARGVRLGRPPALSIKEALEAHQVITQFGESPKAVAEKLNINQTTLDRTFKRYGLDEI